MSEADEVILDSLIEATKEQNKLLKKVRLLEISLFIISSLLLIASIVDCVLRVTGNK